MILIVQTHQNAYMERKLAHSLNVSGFKIPECFVGLDNRTFNPPTHLFRSPFLGAQGSIYRNFKMSYTQQILF